MPLEGITSQKALIFNTKNTKARDFTPAQSMHLSEDYVPETINNLLD